MLLCVEDQRIENKEMNPFVGRGAATSLCASLFKTPKNQRQCHSSSVRCVPLSCVQMPRRNFLLKYFHDLKGQEAKSPF